VYSCMDKLISKINDFFMAIGSPKKHVDVLPAKKKSNQYVSEAISLIELLPEITAIFRKYAGKQKKASVEIGIVTKGDLEITRVLNAFIKKNYPYDLVIGEEENTKQMKSPKGIIVFDPIDGTKNFAEGNPNCCFAFCRFKNSKGALKEGYALIWEPFNHVLTLGIAGYGVIVCGRNIAHTKKITANVTSFASEINMVTYGTFILNNTFKKIDYVFNGSGSVEDARLVTNAISIKLRDKTKLWDFLPGAYLCYLSQKQVFYHTTNENIFPLSLKNILLVLKNAQSKSERRIYHVTIAETKEQRNKICKAYKSLQ
jgi:fructose-1,6-bisphosphatase/inositol monophosphatase family enzyme